MIEVTISFVPTLFRWVRYSTGYHLTFLGVDIYFYAPRFVWE